MFQVTVSVMPSSTYIFLRIFLVIVGTRLKSTECSVFTTEPRDRNVTLNSNVSFECQPNIDFSDYLWRVNGIEQFTDRPGLTINTYTNTTKSELIVLAIMDRDGLFIECGVILADFSRVFSEPPAVVRIQGLLDPVTNMVVDSTSTSITLSWVPPFSLDITGVDPDFTHTVEVYNITSGERSLVYTFPDLTDSTFTFSLNDTGHEGLAISSRDELTDNVFQFIVFAVNDVGEGERRDINTSFLDPLVTTEMTTTTMEATMQSTKAMTTITAEHTTASIEGDSGQTTASDSVSVSELTTILISSTIVALAVGALLGSVITLIMVMIINCLRKHAQQSTALEAESGEIEMKSCDAYNVVAKKQKPVNNQPPPMYEEVDL